MTAKEELKQLILNMSEEQVKHITDNWDKLMQEVYEKLKSKA